MRHADKSELEWRHTRTRRLEGDPAWYGWLPVWISLGAALAIVGVVAEAAF